MSFGSTYMQHRSIIWLPAGLSITPREMEQQLIFFHGSEVRPTIYPAVMRRDNLAVILRVRRGAYNKQECRGQDNNQPFGIIISMNLCLGKRISELKANEFNPGLSTEVKGTPWWLDLNQQQSVSADLCRFLWIMFILSYLCLFDWSQNYNVWNGRCNISHNKHVYKLSRASVKTHEN